MTSSITNLELYTQYTYGKLTEPCNICKILASKEGLNSLIVFPDLIAHGRPKVLKKPFETIPNVPSPMTSPDSLTTSSDKTVFAAKTFFNLFFWVVNLLLVTDVNVSFLQEEILFFSLVMASFALFNSLWTASFSIWSCFICSFRFSCLMVLFFFLYIFLFSRDSLVSPISKWNWH